MTGHGARSDARASARAAPEARVHAACVEPLLRPASGVAAGSSATAAAARTELTKNLGWLPWEHFAALLDEVTSEGSGRQRARRWRPEDELTIVALSEAASGIGDPALYVTLLWKAVLPTWLPCVRFELEQVQPRRLVLFHRMARHLRRASSLDAWLAAQVRVGVRALTVGSSGPWRVDNEPHGERRIRVELPPAPRGLRTAPSLSAIAAALQGLAASAVAPDLAEPSAAPSRRARLHHAAARFGLTRRQEQVLEAILEGMANKEIAARLGCTEATVEFHVGNLLRRMEAQSRAQLVARFWESGQ